MTRLAIAAVALLLGGTSASSGAPAACAATPPVDGFVFRPARWLGPCARGRADGVGVMRFGDAVPYAFFLGQMRGGRPVSGMLIARDKSVKGVVRFDSHLHAIATDGLHGDEEGQVFMLAARAADATAARFAASGNARSAAHYRTLAKTIREGEPE